MERKLFFFLIAGMACLAVCGGNGRARAALCGKCRDLMFVDSPGKCVDCGAAIASDALKLCPKCSARRHQCEHCLAATTAKDEAAAEAPTADATAAKPSSDGSQPQPSPGWTAAKPENPAATSDAASVLPGPELASPPAKVEMPQQRPATPPADKPPAELPPDVPATARPKPIDPSHTGLYIWGKWRYRLEVTSPGTRSEGRWGWLNYNDQKLPRGEVNDYYNTPWGPVYWVDVPNSSWGAHGWMPSPLPQVRRPGRALPLPYAPQAVAAPPTATAAPRLPAAAAPAAGIPARPHVLTLEINKSHNGQMAQLRVGNVLVLRLPGNPASGYQWQAASANTSALRLTVRPQYSPPAGNAAQAYAMGTYTFTFQAVQPGSGSLRLYYVRPQDPSHPRDYFAVGIKIWPAPTTAARSESLGAAAGTR